MPLIPNLLILNASIHTMDPLAPTAEAAAVFQNRIAALGSSADLRALAGPGTRIIDAGGNTVLPGFNDAHVHFISGGFSLSNINLREAATPEEFAAQLRDYVRNVGKGKWILGGDWDHEKWPGAPLPTRGWADAATSDNPVFLSRLDGHMALANSLALKLAGINSRTKDPPGGIIVRDSKTGEPTGLLKDAAQELVERVVPARSLEESVAAAQKASDYAARFGVTSVTDMSAGEDVRVYQHLLERGRLKTRVYAIRSILGWQTLAQSSVSSDFGNAMLRIGGVKGFADGSLGSSTALFFAPYAETSAESAANRGLLFDQMLPEGIMGERVQGADNAGLQIMIHAIGDEANFQILEIFDSVAKQNPPRDRRFRIEHAQHLRPCEIPRFARQGVIASMQPYHAADDGRWCEKRIGPERSKGAYVFRSLLDSGARLAFGSDWTVAPLNPLLGIKAAVTRQTLDGAHPNGWIPEQKITLDEAINAYTSGSAYAEFAEKENGSISIGKLADLVILDRDIYLAPAQVDQAKVRITIMDGKIVFEK